MIFKAFFQRLYLIQVYYILAVFIWLPNQGIATAQKMKFFIKDFFSNCEQFYSFLRIWSRLLKKILMENFIFCAVCVE